MKTTLISGPQGAGKTKLLSLLCPKNHAYTFLEICNTSVFEVKKIIAKNQPNNLLLIDEVFPDYRINTIKEVLKDEDINLVFVSNDHASLFVDEKIYFDNVFRLSYEI